MRIILQDRTSRLYLKEANQWTADIDDAADFKQLVNAIDFVRVGKLRGLDVVMYFGDPKYDFRLSTSPP